jgi:DDE superfamily endonuclease
MRPFDEKELADALPEDCPCMCAFNKHLSSVCITSEHAFGLLKGRFPSMKEMGRHKDIQDAFKAIKAMMILHNICLDWKNRPDQIWDFDPTDGGSDDKDTNADAGGEVLEGEAHIPDHETNVWLMETGRQKHNVIFNELFPM